MVVDVAAVVLLFDDEGGAEGFAPPVLADHRAGGIAGARVAGALLDVAGAGHPRAHVRLAEDALFDRELDARDVEVLAAAAACRSARAACAACSAAGCDQRRRSKRRPA